MNHNHERERFEPFDHGGLVARHSRRTRPRTVVPSRRDLCERDGVSLLYHEPAALSIDDLRVFGDWGTSHLRLLLCRGDRVLDQREGPGVGVTTAHPDGFDFAMMLADLMGGWTRDHGRLPVFLSGMVGSRNGWREAPYVPCPADTQALAASTLRFESSGQPIAIAPGVQCTNPRGAPDVMRGEETQIVGAFSENPQLARGRHVLGLPGTHTKWVLVEDGHIASFQTSFAGELYALLRDHSTLARAGNSASDTSMDRASFELGLARSRQLADVPLAHVLFETRSRQLIEGLPRSAALALLSGLIIGQDVAGCLPLFGAALSQSRTLHLIGAPPLLELYGLAFSGHGITARPMDATRATMIGLRELAENVHAA
jgi:2-dehydro-3-deoxygalactonokinase